MQEGKGGKYDWEAEQVLLGTGCDLVLVMALGGPKGHGFSVAARGPVSPQAVAALLRGIADNLDHGAPPNGIHLTTEEELRSRGKS